MKVGLEPAEPIGIYDVPAPADAAPNVRSIRVANYGVVPLVVQTLRLQNRIYERARDLLEHL